jgi:hypothetical protein
MWAQRDRKALQVLRVRLALLVQPVRREQLVLVLHLVEQLVRFLARLMELITTLFGLLPQQQTQLQTQVLLRLSLWT